VAPAGVVLDTIIPPTIDRDGRQATADAKVPSVVMYDNLGRAKAYGAASDDDATLMDAEDEWIRCEWYVFHILPVTSVIDIDISRPT
jgi:hypothetical protein